MRGLELGVEAAHSRAPERADARWRFKEAWQTIPATGDANATSLGGRSASWSANAETSTSARPPPQFRLTVAAAPTNPLIRTGAEAGRGRG